MAVLVADTFTRADSTSVVGPSETGAVTPTQDVGTWGISVNRVYASAVVSSMAVATWECGTVDVDVTIDLPVFSSGNAGIVFGFVSTTNYYRVLSSQNADEIYVERIGATITTPSRIAQFAAPAVMGGGSAMRAVYKSGHLAVHVGGTLIGRVDLRQAGLPTGTEAGLFASATSTRFDNLSISDSAAISHTNASLNLYKGRDTATLDAAGDG